jgi:hypothetical protein
LRKYGDKKMSEVKKLKLVSYNPYYNLCEHLKNEGYRGVSEHKGIVFECKITDTRWDPGLKRIIATTDVPNGMGSFMAINLYPEGLVTNASFHKNDIRLCVT